LATKRHGPIFQSSVFSWLRALLSRGTIYFKELRQALHAKQHSCNNKKQISKAITSLPEVTLKKLALQPPDNQFIVFWLDLVYGAYFRCVLHHF
jgi:hypothetical protein